MWLWFLLVACYRTATFPFYLLHPFFILTFSRFILNQMLLLYQFSFWMLRKCGEKTQSCLINKRQVYLERPWFIIRAQKRHCSYLESAVYFLADTEWLSLTVSVNMKASILGWDEVRLRALTQPLEWPDIFLPLSLYTHRAHTITVLIVHSSFFHCWCHYLELCCIHGSWVTIQCEQNSFD